MTITATRATVTRSPSRRSPRSSTGLRVCRTPERRSERTIECGAQLGCFGAVGCDKVVQHPRGEAPNTNAAVIEDQRLDLAIAVGMGPAPDRTRPQDLGQRDAVHRRGFVGIDDQRRSGFDDRDERRHREDVALLADHRKLPDDPDRGRRDPDFFMQLAQCGRRVIGVAGVDRTAGKGDLPRVAAQVRGTFDEEHLERRGIEDRHDDGGRTLRLARGGGHGFLFQKRKRGTRHFPRRIV